MTQPSSSRGLLLPLVPIYRLALILRELRLGSGLEPIGRLRFPVISVGSLSAGGSGKTPLTIALVQALTRRGICVDVLSRGYGRQSKLPARVDREGSAEEFGDEPILIASATGVPVYVAAERYRAGLLAEASMVDRQDAVVHLMDDGFQHRQLHRDLDILMLDNRDWRDRLLPAGNLREPPAALRRADVVAIPADDSTLEKGLRDSRWHGPIWRLRRRMEVPAIAGPAVAFCGIARAEQFFDGLELAGLHLADRIVFADHHCYETRDLKAIQEAAGNAGATAAITTEKDLVRLRWVGAGFPVTVPLKTAGLRIEIENEDQAVQLVVDRVMA